MIFGRLICRLRGKHKNATLEFQGCKPDLSSPEGCLKGIPVYRMSCPRCGVSILISEDELAKGIIEALQKGRYDKVEVIQYSSGYKPHKN